MFFGILVVLLVVRRFFIMWVVGKEVRRRKYWNIGTFSILIRVVDIRVVIILFI